MLIYCAQTPAQVLPKSSELFLRIDRNGDGGIDKSEAPRRMLQRFDEFDADEDGSLDEKEFVKLMGRMQIGRRLPEQQDSYWPTRTKRKWKIHEDILSVENVEGEGIWKDPLLERVATGTTPVTAWFDRQFLGDGKAFVRRSQEFSGQPRCELAKRVVETLKTISEQSYRNAESSVRQLVEEEKISSVRWHWIVNGFSCSATPEGIDALKSVPGIKKVFMGRRTPFRPVRDGLEPEFFPPMEGEESSPRQYKHPWYTRYLLADKTWNELGVSGEGTLNVVMDGNFLFSPNVTKNLYRNLKEKPDNGIDDDRNGLIDDYHGYNFDRDSAQLTSRSAGPNSPPSVLHGFMCVAKICGTGSEESQYEFGLAPSATWAGVVSTRHRESAIEWAIEQGADTLSMSFSIPRLGELRSHWRKMMEHAAFCGLCCVSGAGNSAREGSRTYAPIPVQMRVPEDIPLAVFSAAGVQRTFERTPFSSQGPVKWETEHYREGLVDKPELCAFNMDLPKLKPDGTVQPAGLNGNSFAGPMFAGSLALMLSADPDLLTWDARQILIETATDVGSEGFDHQTGHGLINCYRAVREVLRRKAVREGGDAKPYEGRVQDDVLDIAAIKKTLGRGVVIRVKKVRPDGIADKAGVKVGDILEAIDGHGFENRAGNLPRALARAKENGTDQMVFTIRRNGKIRDVDVPVPKTLLQFGFQPERQTVSIGPIFE